MRQKEEGAEQQQDRSTVQHERSAKRRDAEEPQIDERIGELFLATHERRSDHETGHDTEGGRNTHAVLRDELQPIDDRQDRRARERGAQNVGCAGVGIPVLRQEKRPHGEQQDHDGHADQEDRAPPEILQDNAAKQRPDRAAD